MCGKRLKNVNNKCLVIDFSGNCANDFCNDNAITINKQNSGTGKIDPVMALFDAVALMSRNPEAVPPVDVFAMVA